MTAFVAKPAVCSLNRSEGPATCTGAFGLIHLACCAALEHGQQHSLCEVHAAWQVFLPDHPASTSASGQVSANRSASGDARVALACLSQTSDLLCLQVNIKTRTKFMWICTFFCMLEISGFGCRISVIKKPGYAGYVSMQGDSTSSRALLMHSPLKSVCTPAS